MPSSSSSSSSSAAVPVTSIIDETGSILEPSVLTTSPIEGQKPGTSGLRKKTKVFMNGYYLHNFVQSIFDVLPPKEVQGCTMVVSGDGRYWGTEAIQIIIKIAAANGVGRVWIGQGGLLSTPAVSCVIRERENGIAYGGIILTASHNPGGPDEDFGIKYNTGNGGPAPESVTDAIFNATKKITQIKACNNIPTIDLTQVGITTITKKTASDNGVANTFTVEVIDAVEDYAKLLSSLFDFESIRKLLQRPDFSMCYDGLSGVAGIYATRILGSILGAPSSALHNCVPLPDFGGHHPDPNLTYAHDLVDIMGLTREGTINPVKANDAVPDFGAAQDGDADRNMILGKRFFVTPSDSVAIIAANQIAIPFFANTGGLKGVARSMPTSCALDRVAQSLNLQLFEVPTGWKFFGNLMDSASLGGPDYNPFLCGEESFGTGSNHVREKDGLWAVLAWLSILAYYNKDTTVPLVSIETIVRRHWEKFGRNYYCRYDYEGVQTTDADRCIYALRSRITAFQAQQQQTSSYTETLSGGFTLAKVDEFRYVDPVDHSVSDKQGLRFIMSDGSRIVYRLSGTGSVGATIRVYIEKYEADPTKQDVPTAIALKELVHIAVNELGQIEKYTGRKEPTVIT